MKKLLDLFIGFPLCIIFKFFRKFSPSSTKNVLILRLFGMGDAVLTQPLINALQQDHVVDILCTRETLPIYAMMRVKTHILNYTNPFSFFKTLFELRGKYDLVIDTEQFSYLSCAISNFICKYTIGFNFNGRRHHAYEKNIDFDLDAHMAENFLHLINKANPELSPFEIPDVTYQKVKSMLPKGRLIVFHIGTGDTATQRRWPIKNYINLADLLVKKGFTIILTGTNEEAEMVDGTNLKNYFSLINKLSLHEFCALLNCIDVFISSDTGTMHLAAAMGAHQIALFGPNTPTRFKPLNKNAVILYQKLACSPCINLHKGSVGKCTNKIYQECMMKISVDDVYDAVFTCLSE